jgi:hypothetical protein
MSGLMTKVLTLIIAKSETKSILKLSNINFELDRKDQILFKMVKKL